MHSSFARREDNEDIKDSSTEDEEGGVETKGGRGGEISSYMVSLFLTRSLQNLYP